MLKILSPFTSAPRRRRRGFTLVEMLVAMACTILLMYAITQTFQNIGEVSARGRAAIEISTQLRGVQIRLHKDFESLTVPVRPWANPEVAPGYIDIGEGYMYDAATADSPTRNVFGDFDDIIAMTIRSTGEPFVGRYIDPTTKLTRMIQAQVAEVIWFTSFNDKDGDKKLDLRTETVNLHRRVLLVRPDLPTNTEPLSDFIQHNDLSVHQTSNGIVANSLVDLTQRENRFGNLATPRPYVRDAVNVNVIVPTDVNETTVRTIPAGATPSPTFLAPAYALTGDRTGEDVMLSNVLAADIRVFDRLAQVKASEDGVEALSPGDPGYSETITHGHATLGLGAYVDLYYSRYAPGVPVTEFSGAPDSKSGLTTGTYDTWSLGYELISPAPAFDGIDNPPTNGAVDDVAERISSPPYPVPLRGVQIRLRVLEPETRQVRQSTIVQDFIPE
jgi:type II secretory pathway pseudopilin PulG